MDVRSVGRERQPLVVVDGFAPDPDALRRSAIATPFGPAGEHYPGVRAALPDTYMDTQLPVIASALRRAFGRFRRVRVVDASFSIVCTPPASLSIKQRLPHVDAFGTERIAFVHYLFPDATDAGQDAGAAGAGTAFYCHRSTGFETVDDARAPAYFAALGTELDGAGQLPARYVSADDTLFEQTAAADARYNRALIYRSYLLHSGMIGPDAALSPDPAAGRLTVTGFLTVE